MIEKLQQSSDNVLGYKMIGTITKDDYKVMTPEVEALIEQEGSVNLLLDMTECKWEKVTAWGSDLKFGKHTRKHVHKLAVVGHKKWQKWLTDIADPFYAQNARYFEEAESDQAWSWLNED